MGSSFKEMVERDRRLVFLDLDEFGEEHRVEGKTITVVLDDNALKQRQGGARAGRGRVLADALRSSRGSACSAPGW